MQQHYIYEHFSWDFLSDLDRTLEIRRKPLKN